jgi:hypothetical protein
VSENYILKKIIALPSELQKEVIDFIDFLELKVKKNKIISEPKNKRKAGFAKGTFQNMSDDFDKPLDDFKEYME